MTDLGQLIVTHVRAVEVRYVYCPQTPGLDINWDVDWLQRIGLA